VKSDGGFEVSLQSFLTLALDRSEREFPHHIRLSSGNESSVSIEQEAGWKAELVWMMRGKSVLFLQGINKYCSYFQPAAHTVAIPTQYAHTPLY
jgi:hypothetical protein